MCAFAQTTRNSRFGSASRTWTTRSRNLRTCLGRSSRRCRPALRRAPASTSWWLRTPTTAASSDTYSSPVSRGCVLSLYLSSRDHCKTNDWSIDWLPSVLGRCWLGGRKGIRPVKNWVVGCWRGYLSGARCRLAYGPAAATATHYLLLK